jgi:two-component system CheB/CheR fusion protein
VQNFKFVDSIKALIDKLLFQRFALASVLINDQGDILNTTGKIEKYLDQATGKTNINVFALAPQELGPDLIRAVGKAKQNYEAVVIRNKKIATNGSTSFFDVTIQQIEKPEPISGMILIVFSDVSTVIKSVKSKTGNQALNFREQELEIELHRINEELQSFKEKMQTSQEELKSSNEELQSANEELQSTYEELTTSKEELQSMNEVLQTLNTEMQNKISEYIESSNDMQNLLNSINIPTLFIDKELNILRFTEQITKIIKLRQSDIARPFTEMVSDLQYPEIENDAKEVLRTLVFKETDISANDERWFKVRIMPYRTFNDYINGVVITFIDITESKKREEELTNANEMLKAAAAK